ncbi:hypothetical protein [Glutamicibacter sp. NPDC087583]|uniref:hypothetical protein n=1 Tax=Glutamicibacter sp. NPDC087583 TaxID=3363995 RepID=UPI003806D19E
MDIQAWETQYRAIYGELLKTKIDYPQDALISIMGNHNWAGEKMPLRDFDRITERLVELDRRGVDLYFRVSPLENKWYHPKSRGAAADGLGLPALYADIDTRDGVHKPATGEQAGLDHPTRAEAVKVLKSMILPPSLLISSGGGLHAYWTLKERLKIRKNDAGKLDLTSYPAEVLARWAAYVRTSFNEHGFCVDYSVSGDTARVLRVAGTTNHKDPGNRKPVEILSVDPTSDRSQGFWGSMLPQLPKIERKARLAGATSGAASERRAATKKQWDWAERVPVSFIMEELWGMSEIKPDGWVLPQGDGRITSKAPHGYTFTAESGVQFVTAFGQRLMDAWGTAVPGSPALSSYDLMLQLVGDDREVANLIIKTYSEPSDDLVDALVGVQASLAEQAE